MGEHTHFGHLLAILDDVLNEQSPAGGSHASMDEQDREVIEHLRASPEAQVMLLVLAWEMKVERIDDEGVLRHELRAFAATIRDRFDVDLLGAAADDPSTLPAAFPTVILPDHASGGES